MNAAAAKEAGYFKSGASSEFLSAFVYAKEAKNMEAGTKHIAVGESTLCCSAVYTALPPTRLQTEALSDSLYVKLLDQRSEGPPCREENRIDNRRYEEAPRTDPHQVSFHHQE